MDNIPHNWRRFHGMVSISYLPRPNHCLVGTYKLQGTKILVRIDWGNLQPTCATRLVACCQQTSEKCALSVAGWSDVSVCWQFLRWVPGRFVHTQFLLHAGCTRKIWPRQSLKPSLQRVWKKCVRGLLSTTQNFVWRSSTRMVLRCWTKSKWMGFWLGGREMASLHI